MDCNCNWIQGVKDIVCYTTSMLCLCTHVCWKIHIATVAIVASTTAVPQVKQFLFSLCQLQQPPLSFCDFDYQLNTVVIP